MCGRYDSPLNITALKDLWDITHGVEIDSWTPNADVRPTTRPLILLQQGSQRVLEAAKWGWPRPWMKTVLINAMSETANTKRTFVEAFRTRRCIVLASGFYEWQTADDGTKTRMRFAHPQQPLMGIGGIWEDDAETAERRFLILTTSPNAVVSPIHSRMPVVIGPPNFRSWMNPELPIEAVEQLCRPIGAADIAMEPRPDAPRASRAKNSGSASQT